MDEDIELNALVRTALESKAPFVRKGVGRTAVSRWRPGPWAVSSLLAASVALAVALCLPGRGRTTSVEEAILLLSEADGIEFGGETASATDLLVAWQETAG